MIRAHVAEIERLCGDQGVDYAPVRHVEPLDYALFASCRGVSPEPGALMAFLAPLFLAGSSRSPFRSSCTSCTRSGRTSCVFPSLMFLTRMPYQAVRRQRIRDWLLFALRCLALILLAVAFARPFLTRPAAAAPVRGPARRSWSSCSTARTAWRYGDRWTRAVRRCAARDRGAGRGRPRVARAVRRDADGGDRADGGPRRS